MAKKIVVPIDGSQTAKNALEFAITMAKAYGDEIRLLNVQPNHKILGESIVAEANVILEKAQVAYSSVIRIGTPTIEIISEATDAEVRCIVMGAKGAGMNSNRKIGSVSQAILSMTPCPIMFIPN